jgi:hypothetical protein
MARIYGQRHHALFDALEESLDPRGPDMLLDAAGDYLRPGACILDIGCRDAKYLIRLVQAHDCRGVGFDPVPWNVERARAAVDEAGLGERIQVTTGAMERIDQPDETFDLVWCRDVLEVVEGLEQGVLEAAFARAGFVIDRTDVIGTEWREYERSENRWSRVICFALRDFAGGETRSSSGSGGTCTNWHRRRCNGGRINFSASCSR